MKKIEDFKEFSRQSNEEECLRKKQELEERLVPKRESQIDVEMTIQRLQDEARQRIQQKEDQIDRKLKEIKSIQEKEDLKKKAQLQISEVIQRYCQCYCLNYCHLLTYYCGFEFCLFICVYFIKGKE